MKQWKLFVAALAAVTVLVPLAGSATASETSTRYIVVLAGTQEEGGFALAGTKQAALTLVATAGGTVANDLSKQIGVLVVESPNALFRDVVASSPFVEEVGADWSWKAFPSYEEAVASGELAPCNPSRCPDEGSGEQSGDVLEPLQWDMQQIRTEQAHITESGERTVDVGVLDSGIDGRHVDFVVDTGGSNVDCLRGHNSVTFLGPGLGTPDPCTDNQFHGTHVAGTIAAQSNGIGVVGVAPNVTLVPVKVCDTPGFCYASAVVDGITYAGDQKFDVINMSFFVDDNETAQSTEFKCSSDPVQRAFRHAVERAIAYARNQGVTPVAALGNSDEDLAHPSEPNENECDVVPAETQGVVGTMALGRDSEKAGYSNYGTGMTDVAAPGGNGTTGDCTTTILSTIPGNLYGCIQGTSMASPHAAGVAALIVSRFGKLGSDGDVVMPPQQVENYLQATTVDIGLPGYDECFGNGRVDALKAVTHDTSRMYDASAPFCPEYAE